MGCEPAAEIASTAPNPEVLTISAADSHPYARRRRACQQPTVSNSQFRLCVLRGLCGDTRSCPISLFLDLLASCQNTAATNDHDRPNRAQSEIREIRRHRMTRPRDPRPVKAPLDQTAFREACYPPGAENPCPERRTSWRCSIGAALSASSLYFSQSFGMSAALRLSAQQPPAQQPPAPPPVARTPGAPEGEVIKAEFDRSQVYPGTWREYWVYVPKQLDRTKPAPVMVFQDGIQYSAPIVLDNLIHAKTIPPMVGVFVMHGRVRAPNADALDRMNRSYRVRLGERRVRAVPARRAAAARRKDPRPERCRTTRTIAASLATAAARLRRSPRRGSVRTRSGASSAPSGRMSDCAAATSSPC